MRQTDGKQAEPPRLVDLRLEALSSELHTGVNNLSRSKGGVKIYTAGDGEAEMEKPRPIDTHTQ